MQSKFYAVRRGRVKGVYRTWAECFEQIKNYPHAQYKSFTNITDAFDYVKWNNAEKLEFANSGHKSNFVSAIEENKKLEKAVQKIIDFSKKINKTT
ncbi:RNase H1/viroplasmin domain-containing protein [Lactobacillus crispatus]|uniref:RNase H1/viroplasmin domain-containing protein n=1 Tax=Lactobacillus crispatus TaxID=47770 RepID=A0ABV2BDV5_9LACO|nr:RNase H1/viroplasmin domain-containing protein [Lactobacillus crispatus]TDM96669.1 hypothetical protein CEE88_11365 [Lactobacillus crispatus]